MLAHYVAAELALRPPGVALAAGLLRQIQDDGNRQNIVLARKLDKRLLKVDGEAVALVGHQPDLGEYAGRLIGAKKARLKLAKPSVVCIECDEPPGKEAGELQWLLPPKWFGPSAAPAEDEGPVLYADRGR